MEDLEQEASGAPVLGTEPTLRNVILEHLRRRGQDSISGVTRALAAARAPAKPLHRLTVAGYLKALAEGGVLRESDFGPSKHYALANPEAHQGLHRWVGRAVTEMDLPADARLPLALAALQALLGRPIFAAEIREAGFEPDPSVLERITVSDMERRRYRELFRRKAKPLIAVPDRDPMYGPPRHPHPPDAQVQEVLRRVIVGSTGSEHLSAPRTAAGFVQGRLDLEEP